jgi:hypothetical protein
MLDLEVPPIVRDAFDSRDLGAEPPLRLTPAGLLDAGRRAQRRQRLVRGGGASATALVAALAAAALPGLGAGPGGGVSGGGTSLAPAASATTGRAHPPAAPPKASRQVAPPRVSAATGPPRAGGPIPPRAAPSTEPRAVAAARLTAALRAALHVPGGLTARPAQDSGMPVLVVWPSQGGFKAIADLVSAAGTGGVVVYVSGVPAGPVRCPRPDRTSTCQLQDGNAISISQQTLTDGTTRWSVTAVRPDHSSVGITASNAQIAALDGGGARLRQPPLSVQQLTALALTPGMSYYPPR